MTSQIRCTIFRDDVDERMRAPNALGQTPLHLAGISGHTNGVRWFLKMGVEPSAKTPGAMAATVLAHGRLGPDPVLNRIFQVI